MMFKNAQTNVQRQKSDQRLLGQRWGGVVAKGWVGLDSEKYWDCPVPSQEWLQGQMYLLKLTDLYTNMCEHSCREIRT